MDISWIFVKQGFRAKICWNEFWEEPLKALDTEKEQRFWDDLSDSCSMSLHVDMQPALAVDVT